MYWRFGSIAGGAFVWQGLGGFWSGVVMLVWAGVWPRCALPTIAPGRALRADTGPSRVVTKPGSTVPLGVLTPCKLIGALSALLGRLIWKSRCKPWTFRAVSTVSCVLLPLCWLSPLNCGQSYAAVVTDISSEMSAT